MIAQAPASDALAVGSMATRARPSSGLSIGIPWILVLLHALALIVSSMIGLAMACSLF